MVVTNALFLLANLSAFSERCSIHDTPCLSSLTQNYANVFVPGGTGFGLEPLDPMSLDAFSGNENGCVYSLSEIEIVGGKSALVETVQFNKKEKKYHIKMHIPVLTIFANYKSDGIIQGFPFKCEGKMVFKLHDFVNDMTMSYEMMKAKNGKEYISCTDFFYWFDFNYFEPHLESKNKDATVEVVELQNYFKMEGRKVWQQYGRGLLDRVNEKIFNMVQKVHLLQPTENILTEY